LFLFFIFWAKTPLLAQHPTFRQYTTEDGLASSEVYCILQDKKDYIWISTDNGVSKFDGYGFYNYGVIEGLKENVVFAMQLDTLGRVWMQAQSGNLYYLEGDTILPYWNNEVLTENKNRPDWSKGFIVEGAGKTVHVSSLNGGILTISNNGQVSTLPGDTTNGYRFFEKNSILLKSLVWNDTKQQPAENLDYTLRFITPAGTWDCPQLNLTEKTGQAPVAFRLAEGQYLLKIYNDLWYLENGHVKWHRYFPFAILYAQKMNDGKLYLGLHRYQGLRVYPSTEALFQDKGTTWLPGQSVSYFIEDRQGGHWFATNENGVFYTPADAFDVYDTESGLPDNKVTAISLEGEEQAFAGLGNGEVWKLGQGTGTWDKLPAFPGSGAVRDLFYDSDNNKLLAGANGLYVYSDGFWKQIKDIQNGKVSSMGNRITRSPTNGRLWSCDHNGFMANDLQSLAPLSLLTGYGHRTYIVQEDFSGRVWVGSPTGLFEWENDSLASRQNLHPAFDLRVEDIALMPDSTLAVATKGGGVVFWKNGKSEQITTSQGLTADMLECIHASSDASVWAGTLNGLNRISGSWGSREVEQITTAHGLPSNEINRVATWGDRVWVATSKGLVSFLPKEKNLTATSPILSALLANNVPMPLATPLRLYHNQNNLTIRFFAINYKMNGKIPYRYRMGSNAWTTTLSRSANFPALPPGERRFEVQAQNEDGVWSKSTVLQFEILPPWYDTWWARSLGLLVAALLALGFYNYRTRQLKEAHRIQLQMVELERSALQAQMNPHFIFNCLNSIQNFILQNEKADAIQYLGSFAALVRSMLNASVAGKISLAEEIKLLNNYLSLEKLRFKNRFDYVVGVAPDMDVFEVKFPPLLVQPYVENAVLHGIAGRERGGRVEVFFKKKKNQLEVTIQDNGLGIPPDKDRYKPTRAHRSVGMSITQNRLKLLADGRMGNKVKIGPLQNESGKVEGTEVVIYIGLTEKPANTKF